MSYSEYKKRSFTEQLEYRIPIIVGIGEALIGLMLTVAPELIKIPEAVAHFLPHLGIGVLAAGVLTATIEPIARKRLQHDILAIRSAHFETMLRGLMPEPIFEQVQAHIIMQPFLRSNFYVTAELNWKDEAHEYLSQFQTIRYDVTNIARTIEQFKVSAFEERMHEDKFPNSTKIHSISIQRPDYLEPDEYKGERLDKIRNVTDQVVEVSIPIQLLPGQKAKVAMCIDSILASRDVYTHVMINPTINFDLTVIHPENLIVRGMPLHPSSSAFVTDMDTPKVKRWRIEAGILPFQGIEVSCRLKSAYPEQKSIGDGTTANKTTG
jgi:hypothetical protein